MVYLVHGLVFINMRSDKFSLFLTFRPSPCVGVAGLAETFPSLLLSGPFITDLSGYCVLSDNVLPSQPGYSSRVPPFHLQFSNCSKAKQIYNSFRSHQNSNLTPGAGFLFFFFF